MTMVASSPLAGAEMITLRALALRCRAAWSRLRKRPVDSITTSTPSPPQSSLAGSGSAVALIRSPSTVMAEES
jgi:hypothetical protein